MKTNLSILLALLGAALAAPAIAALGVFATVPEWGALAKELGGDNVSVYTATNALQDPHHVEAKPSLIARARSADLVVATGAELEVGWLPLVTLQVCDGLVGCEDAVTLYALPLAMAVAKVKLPLAVTFRLSPLLSCSTSPLPDRPDTEPPTVYVPGRPVPLRVML